jgi:hypothetical protein
MYFVIKTAGLQNGALFLKFAFVSINRELPGEIVSVHVKSGQHPQFFQACRRDFTVPIVEVTTWAENQQ